MPVTGQVDLSDILSSLGDPDHGLKEAGPAENDAVQEEDYIYRATWGQADMSTEVALERAWNLIWDVNGYYRSLGITWPFTAGKRDLRIAYQQHNGMDDRYLTYVFKQLLNPKIRARYDAMPLGSTFKDKYVLEEEMRRLSKLAGELSEGSGKVVSVDELAEQVLEEADQLRRQRESLKPIRKTWEWGFYLLNSRKYDYEDLKEWQTHLTRSFAEHHVAKLISIGYIGEHTAPYVIKTWQGKTIFFLNEEATPSLELSQEAVASYLAPHTEGKHDRRNRSSQGRSARSRAAG